MKVTVGMNDCVRVTLNERGAEILNDHNKQHTNKRYVAGEKFDTSLWLLFRIFGPHCIGGESFFFDEIEIYQG
jgi:hypothetical protein